MTIRTNGRTIPTLDTDLKQGVEGVIAVDPSAAQLLLWHGQAKFDLGEISSKELAVLEAQASSVAGRARTIYNPYTGEIRKVFLPDWVGKRKPDAPPQVGWTSPYKKA